MPTAYTEPHARKKCTATPDDDSWHMAGVSASLPLPGGGPFSVSCNCGDEVTVTMGDQPTTFNLREPDDNMALWIVANTLGRMTDSYPVSVDEI